MEPHIPTARLANSTTILYYMTVKLVMIIIITEKSKEFKVYDILNPWLVWFCCRRLLILLSLSMSGSIVAHCDGVHTQPEAIVVGVTVVVAVVV